MPYEVKWLVPGRIVMQRFFGKVTMDDVKQAGPEQQALVKTGMPMIHTIIDATMVEAYPNIIELKQGASMKRDEMEGWRIVIGAEGMMRFAASFVLQLTGQRYRLLDTIYDALAFLQEQDETLDLTKVES